MGNAPKQGKLEEAIEAYNKALAIKPDYEAPERKSCINCAICNWDSIAKDVNLIPELGISEKHVSPFASFVFRGCS
jgi:tetratricopeptide (TPR) repeat protein